MTKEIDMGIERKRPFDPEWYMKEKRSEWVLSEVLKERAESMGDAPFLRYQEEKPLSFKEVNLLANRVANALTASGIEKGDRVAILEHNSSDYVITWFGILKASAVMAPINNAYKMDFLEYVLNNSDSKILFISEKLLEHVAPIQDKIPQVKKIVVRTGGGAREFDNKGVVSIPLVSFNEFVDSSSTDEPQTEPSFTDVARLMYTSGTTGRSKGVLKSNAADYYSAKGFCELCEITHDDVLFTCLPLFHSNAQVLTIYPALIAGAQVVVYERFSASRFWKWIKASGATIFNSLGAMNYFLWNQKPHPEEKEHKVRLALLAPSPHDMLERFMERFNLKIFEGYGLTETGVVTYMRPDKPFRIGSCGIEASGYEVKIVDPDTDEELDRNHVGEIVVRPRIPNIMLYGYHKMPEKTVSDFRNFWFHTGDAGRIDEDGYVYFVDRVKDYIRRRGENISSFEVERVVCQYPDVLEAAAFGIKSSGGRYAEDDVMVVVTTKPGSKLNFEQLAKHCEERMPYFMVPNYIRVVDKLPKTPTERVRKHLLKDEGITPDTWDMAKAGYKVKK